MSKQSKPVNETRGGILPKLAKGGGNGKQEVQPPNSVQLTLENAPIFSAKFLEMIVVELRRLNVNLEKFNNG